MSRKWTPKEWDMIHNKYPELSLQLNNIVFIDKDGNKTPLTTQEQKEQFEKYPKLNLIGNNFLNLCYEEGLFSNGSEIIKMIEDILSGNSYDLKDFEEKVHFWYDGKLALGMNNNDMALVEEVKNMIRKWGQSVANDF